MSLSMIWATDWLWPFVLATMALVAVFTGALVWSAGADRAAFGQTSARVSAQISNQKPSGSTWRVWLLTLAVPLAAMALYAALGNPRGLNPRERQPVPDEAVETMVSKLAVRLKAEPHNANGWLMLARSYQVLQRYDESAAAWEHAQPLAWDDVEAMTEWTEARVLSQQYRFDRRSQELLARAMSLDASHPGVLMLRALSALDRGDTAVATKLLTQLRGLYPEGSADAQALDGALAQLAAGQDPRVQAPRVQDSRAGAVDAPPTPKAAASAAAVTNKK
ncbi:tetratricopeptide repeat protein [Ottowia sp.]|uniref:tetratricopeptide repeat protein n=1 Tax=Ottowia sp. TaxID=1898956 RepID=UPI003A8443DF